MKQNDEAMEEIVRLLNMGETSEALYELRKLHGLVNRFVCVECGHAFDIVTGWKCADCGGDVEVKVVIYNKEPTETLGEACARGDVSGQIRDVDPVDLEAIRKEISDLFWKRGSTIPECVDAAMAHIERLAAKIVEGK